MLRQFKIRRCQARRTAVFAVPRVGIFVAEQVTEMALDGLLRPAPPEDGPRGVLKGIAEQVALPDRLIE